MEQIYYTQCPVGYGLGASNGFQVKRITPGYPVAGDFRHLGLRAFPGGGRTLAPAALRYRRVGDTAEVAWLTPRPLEYETERGLWGRPGGHFAHGLILTREELRSIADWPAGLFESTVWRRSDPEPSRGRAPEAVSFSREDLIASLDFPAVAKLVDGLDIGLLARLLTSLTAIGREGRTLFLIDEASHLGPRVALLTFLMPPPFRAAITFSTFHDRPEELPGYRIHGTTPGSRPNRSLLLTQGIVADLTTGAIEPRNEPAAWAVEVARWAANGSATEWADFVRRLALGAGSPGFKAWDDAWLDRLVAFGRAVGRETPGNWDEEAELAAWAARSNLASVWASARGPAWWRRAEVGAGGHAALLTLAGWPATWKRHRVDEWGEVVGRWFADASPVDREAAAVAFAKGAPAGPARFAFVGALRHSLPDQSWEGVRARLDAAFADDPKTVALWTVPEAVAEAVAGRPESIRELAERLDGLGEPVETLLEAAHVEADGRQGRVQRLGEALADRFHRPDALRWALRRGERARDWLRPWLRHHLAFLDDGESRRALLDATPADLRSSLARAVLDVTSDPSLPDDAFVWAVEDVLLPIPEADRPADPEWPGRYLDRSASDVALIARVFVRATRSPALRAWLDAARSQGGLGPGHLARLAHLQALSAALDERIRAPLDRVDLPRIPGRDRGEVLAQFLRRDASGSTDSGPTLERCGLAWPESFRPESSDFEEMVQSLAESELLRRVDNPADWFGRLAEICRCLKADSADSGSLPPHGLAASVVAHRNGADPSESTWAVRRHLLHNAAGWRLLAEDLRRTLASREPAKGAEIVEGWDRRIEQRTLPARFWEVVLNACDGRRLGAVVSGHGEKLRSLPALPWWDHTFHPDACDDLRDAFARLIPMAPLLSDHGSPDAKALMKVMRWFRLDESAPIGGLEISIEIDPNKTPQGLSRLGRSRWTCLDDLTRDIFDPRSDDSTHRARISRWCETRVHAMPDGSRAERYALPLGDLSVDDRYRFLAWVISRVQNEHALNAQRFSKLLMRSGVTDLDRVKAWPTELSGLVELPGPLVRAREDTVYKLLKELRETIRDAKESAAQVIRPEPDSAGAG